MTLLYGDTPPLFGSRVLRSPSDLRGIDLVALGIPWEGAVTWDTWSGCELGPKVMRHASLRYSGFLPEFDINVWDHLTLGDYGDVSVTNHDTEATFAAAEARVTEILAAGAIPVILGGDHAVPIPVVRALARCHAGKRIGVIQYDAHYDNFDEFQGDRNARNCPMRRIAETPGVRPDRIVQIGIRGPRNQRGGAAYARESGATVFTMRDIRREGMEAITRKAIEIAHDGTDLVYVTVDSDVMDVAFNPGGPVDPAGISSWELVTSLYEVGRAGFAGCDFVEVYPPSDPRQLSAHAMVVAMLYLFGGLAESRR